MITDDSPSEWIVLYSKYSPQCKRILNYYDASTSPFRLLCVDNAAIRAIVQQDNVLNVKTVPCVVFCYPDNRTETFEGPEVTEWILSQIEPSATTGSNVIVSQQNPQSITPLDQLPQSQQPPQPPQSNTNVTSQSSPVNVQPLTAMTEAAAAAVHQQDAAKAYESQGVEGITDLSLGSQLASNESSSLSPSSSVTQLSGMIDLNDSNSSDPTRKKTTAEIAADMEKERTQLMKNSMPVPG